MKNKNMYQFVVVSLFLAGSFAGCLAPYEGGGALSLDKYSSFLWMTKVATNLASLEKDDNTEGLEDISERYDVDVVTPVDEFFTSASSLIHALKELKQAVSSDSSRAPLTKEMEVLLEALELDSLPDETASETERD